MCVCPFPSAIPLHEISRHLSLVRNAFAGVPTLVKEFISPEEAAAAVETSDILCVYELQ